MNYMMIYFIGITSLLGLSATLSSNNSFYTSVLWGYCGAEVRFNKYKNKLLSGFKTVYQKIIPKNFTPSMEIFYYKNDVVVSKSTLINTVMYNHTCTIEYDFLTYIVKNDRGETLCRYFENHNDLIVEFIKNNSIDCISSNPKILSALLIINGFNGEELYDVTPTNLGIELQGNKLYSYNFIKHFFNINPGEEYQIKIIDQNINEIVLVNNFKQKQILHLTECAFKVETLYEIKQRETSKHPSCIFIKPLQDTKDN